MRPHPRGAETDTSNPKAWATCERCGFIYNLHKLSWQLEWRGVSLSNIRILVCEPCYDTPQRQLGTVFIPPDPPPIINARPEQYSLDEQPVSTRVTVAGSVRVIKYAPYPVNRIATVPGNLANP